jgi:hypothetical protein
MINSCDFIKWKPPADIKNDFYRNLKEFKILRKVIPDSELALRDDYIQYVYNTKSKKRYLIKSKYTMDESEFAMFLDLAQKHSSSNEDCYKQKNKWGILDIDFFDLNSDGNDEFIMSNNCSMLNHYQYYYVIEKKDDNLKILFQESCEFLVVTNKIYNGYFILDDEGPESRIVPSGAVIIASYKYDGKEYKKFKEDFDDESYGDY